MKTKKRKSRRETNIHHRIPRAVGGGNTPENMVEVSVKKHEAYHTLFGHGGDVRYTAKILNDTWIDPNYRLIVVEVVKPNENQLKLFNDS